MQQEINQRYGHNSNIVASAERILKLRTSILPMAYKHTCRRDFCDPWSEADLVEHKLLAPTERIINPSVYVCAMRSVHVCTPDRCELYVGTHDGVCPVTNIYHGHTNGEMAYVAPEKRTAHFKRTSSKRTYSASAAKQGGDADQGEETPLGEKRLRLEELRDYAKTSAMGALFQTTSSAVALDNATPEAQEKQEKQEKQLFVEAKQTSRRTLNASQRKKQKNHNTAEAIITQLLYSDRRKEVNQNKRDQLNAKRDQVVRNYYAARENKTFPILTEVMNISAAFDMHPPHMRILKLDRARLARYVDICLQTWEIVIATPWSKENPGYRFETHVLSVLFKMRRGLIIDKLTLLPFDSYLFYLPFRIDLPLFGKGYESSIVTNGIKHLVEAYHSAIRHPDWTPERLMLK